MILYIVKVVADITTADINSSTSGRVEDFRCNNVGTKAILGFDEEVELYRENFLSEVWYTKEELEEEVLTDPEWDI